MSMTDPVADLLTRIRNAQVARHETVSVPASKLKEQIANVLRDEGYILEVEREEDNRQGVLLLKLKYTRDGRPAITEILRKSRPGRRWYVAVQDIPRVKNGLGIAILSTSQGVLADSNARRQRAGGELLCTVW